MHRKRLQRIEIDGHAHFLTFSCYQRLPLFKNDMIKNRFLERLARACETTSMSPLAWVVMPEHVHLIVFSTAPAATVVRFLHTLKKPFAAEVIRRWKALDARVLTRLTTRTGHSFWQPGGGYDRNVWGKELLEKIRYIHANPVRRGLASCSTDYAWSSARAYEGSPCAGPPIDFMLLPPSKGPLT